MTAECACYYMQQRCFSVTVSEPVTAGRTWRQPAVKRTTECCRRLHPRRSWKTRCTGGSGADCTDSADAIVDVIVCLLDTLSAASGCCQRTIANDHVQIMSQKLMGGKQNVLNRPRLHSQRALVRSSSFASVTLQGLHPLNIQRWDFHTCLL